MVLAVVSQSDVVYFGFFLLFIFLAFFAIFVISHKIRNKQALSPYTGIPLRRGRDMPYASMEKVLRFLYNRHEYDNKIFTIANSAVCRETGRIFPNCTSWLGTINVKWDFLQKRFPGTYVSWGSLSDAQREAIIAVHDSLDGFQTEFSCPLPSPNAIEPQYAFAKPGPMYVDLSTRVILGWQIVPGTPFEVLIVQRPRQQHKY